MSYVWPRDSFGKNLGRLRAGERYSEPVEDRSRRLPDVRAAWVSFFTGVGPRR